MIKVIKILILIFIIGSILLAGWYLSENYTHPTDLPVWKEKGWPSYLKSIMDVVSTKGIVKNATILFLFILLPILVQVIFAVASLIFYKKNKIEISIFFGILLLFSFWIWIAILSAPVCLSPE